MFTHGIFRKFHMHTHWQLASAKLVSVCQMRMSVSVCYCILLFTMSMKLSNVSHRLNEKLKRILTHIYAHTRFGVCTVYTCVGYQKFVVICKKIDKAYDIIIHSKWLNNSKFKAHLSSPSYSTTQIIVL